MRNIVLQDKFAVVVALALLTGFCGIIVWFVAEPDLTIVVALCLALAYYDFWISVLRRRSGDEGAGIARQRR